MIHSSQRYIVTIYEGCSKVMVKVKVVGRGTGMPTIIMPPDQLIFGGCAFKLHVFKI
jgi:hypothetical protein